MTDVKQARASVVMHFGDGSEIHNWQSLHLVDDFTDPLGSLTLETAPVRNQYEDYRRKLQKGELVTLLINGVNQGGFLIQTVERKISKKAGAVIQITCHTPLVTPYQGHVDPDLALSFKSDVTVGDPILKAMEPYGFDTLFCDDVGFSNVLSGIAVQTLNSKGKRRRRKLSLEQLKIDQAKPHENEAAYQFCTRLVTRLGAVLRSTPEGYLHLSRPNYFQPGRYTVVQSFGQRAYGLDVDYFVGDVLVHDSNDEQFSECVVRGQRSDTPGQKATQRPVARIVEAELHPDRPSYQSVAAAHKPKILRDKNSRDPDRAKAMAEFELGVRAMNAYWVQGEVNGFVSATGAIWTVDSMCRVVVEADELDEEMYLVRRELSLDREGGERCRMKFIPDGSLVLGEPPV